MDRYLFIYVDIALQVLGGGWRQAGVLAAAGLYALDHMVDRCGQCRGHMIIRACDKRRFHNHGEGPY